LSTVLLAMAAPVQAKETDLAIPPAPEPRQIPFGLFGTLEFKTNNLSKLIQWRQVVRRARSEEQSYLACELRGVSCDPIVSAWRDKLDSLRDLEGRAQLRDLNRFINLRATHREDIDNYRKSDYWTTPKEFLASHGDCEDFAIIKFFSLLELGYSNDQIRLIVVKDVQRNLPHAVVSVTVGDQTYIMDSLFHEPVPHQYVLHYEPVYSVNLTTRWAHIVTPQIRNKFLDYIASTKISQR
jgi:predicted transglutaminase-like cysteine proteinase